MSNIHFWLVSSWNTGLLGSSDLIFLARLGQNYSQYVLWEIQALCHGTLRHKIWPKNPGLSRLDPSQMAQLGALILTVSIKLKLYPKFLFDMGNKLLLNLTKISGALSQSHHQNEAAYEKLVIMGLFVFPFGITVSVLSIGNTVTKSDPKIICVSDPTQIIQIKALIFPYKY